jgi:hypothetical protein
MCWRFRATRSLVIGIEQIAIDPNLLKNKFGRFLYRADLSTILVHLHVKGAHKLVPRPRGFDWLNVSYQDGQVFRRNEDLDAARHAGLASDEACTLEG